jgi:predicted ester cyclase
MAFKIDQCELTNRVTTSLVFVTFDTAGEVTKPKFSRYDRAHHLGVAGRRMWWLGISVDRVEGGKIAENWVSWGMMSMLQQLGAVSWPPRP